MGALLRAHAFSPPTQQDPAKASGSEERGLDVRLTTFNLLAPCYKRIPSEVPGLPAGTGLLASQAKTLHTARESEFAGLWRERALETVGLGVEAGRVGGGGELWRCLPSHAGGLSLCCAVWLYGRSRALRNVVPLVLF